MATFDDEEKKQILKPEEEITKKDNSIGLSQIGELDAPEKAAVSLGAIQQWERSALEDFKTYEKLLKRTQKDEDANFKRSGGEEGTADYVDTVRSMIICEAALKNKEAKLNEKRIAFDRFYNMALRYRGNHREIFRSHITEQAAERYRIINSMADLAEAHLKLYDDYRIELDISLKTFNTKYYCGSQKISELKSIVQSKMSEKGSSYEDYEKRGKDGYKKEKQKRESSILFARYGRRTGLKKGSEKATVKEIWGKRHSMKELAQNFLDRRFREAISFTDSVEKFIAVNEPIRDKIYQKEVNKLAENWCFNRFMQENMTDSNWFSKWTEIENKSGQLLNSFRKRSAAQKREVGVAALAARVFNENNTPETAHTFIAEAMLYEALSKRKNKPLLNAVACEQVIWGRLVDDVAYYIQCAEPLDLYAENPEDEVKRFLGNSALISGVANRVTTFFLNYHYLKQDEAKRKINGGTQTGNKQ